MQTSLTNSNLKRTAVQPARTTLLLPETQGKFPPSIPLKMRPLRSASYTAAESGSGPPTYFVKSSTAAQVIGMFGSTNTPFVPVIVCSTSDPWIVPSVLPSKVWPPSVTPLAAQ
jgi:hypothetical protein